MTNLSVAVVEDNDDIRMALEQIINMSEAFKLCCSCSSGTEALEKLPLLNPQVVLMDIKLGDMEGTEVIRKTKRSHPRMLFMMCTIYEENEKIFEALNAGASGYLVKNTSPLKILEAIRELYEGGAPMSNQIARKVVLSFQQKSASPDNESLDNLTNRENRILRMLANGLIYKEISAELFISIPTVRKHVYNVYKKLHVSNRVEAVNVYFCQS